MNTHLLQTIVHVTLYSRSSLQGFQCARITLCLSRRLRVSACLCPAWPARAQWELNGGHQNNNGFVLGDIGVSWSFHKWVSPKMDGL